MTDKYFKKSTLFSFIATSAVSILIIFFENKTSGLFDFYVPIPLLVAINGLILTATLFFYKKEISFFFKESTFLKNSINILFFFMLFLLAFQDIVSNNPFSIFNEIKPIIDSTSQYKPYLVLYTIIFGVIFILINKEVFSRRVEIIDKEESIKIISDINVKKEIEWGKIAIKSAIVLITLLYVSVTIAIPILYKGGFIDEYLHMNSGVEILKTGNFAESNVGGEYYTRGAYVSYMTALAFFIFGQSIFVAKMVPAIIGIINFFLLLGIINMMMENKKFIPLALFAYASNPLILFNHFYLRMYVFYEFFILAIVYLFRRMILARDGGRDTWPYCVGIILLNLICYFLSNDYLSYIIIGFSLVLIGYFYINSKILEKEERMSKKKIIISISVAVAIMGFFFVIMNFSEAISRFLYGSFEGETPENMKYFDFFFLENGFFTTLFILASVLPIFIKFKIKKWILLMFGILFFVHTISSQDIQILRVILYFIPFYIAMYAISLSIISLKFRKTAIALVLVSVSLLLSNPRLVAFAKIPELQNEVYYTDYQEVSDFTKETCVDKTIFAINANYARNFIEYHKVPINFIPYIYDDVLFADKNFMLDENNRFVMTNNFTPTIRSKNYLNETENKNLCIIIPNNYSFAWRGITKNDFEKLDKLFEIEKFKTMNVYFN